MKTGGIIMAAMVILFTLPSKGQVSDSIPPDQEIVLRRHNDSLQALSYLRKARNYYLASQYDSSSAYAIRSASLASYSGFTVIRAGSHELLGSVYDLRSDWENMLRNYLRASEAYRKTGMNRELAEMYRKIAGKYLESGIYARASFYFEKEYDLRSDSVPEIRARAAVNAGASLFLSGNDSLSIVWYKKSLSLCEIQHDSECMILALQKLAELEMIEEDYSSAYEYYNRLLSVFRETGDFRNEAAVQNNLGVLKFRKRDYQGALSDFNLAAEADRRAGSDSWFLAEVFSHIALCQQSLGQQQQMNESFLKALRYARESGHNEEAARINHLLSLIYFRRGDNYHAELYCLDCIESAVTAAARPALQDCYKTYSEILEAGNDFVKALEFFEKYLSIKEALAYEEKTARQEQLSRQQSFEDLEQRLILEIAQEENQVLAIRTLQSESEKKENEIKLLQKQRELERSEQERELQSFALERERFSLNMREQQVASLQQKKRADSLQIAGEQAKTRALDLENRALEDEKLRQQQDMEREKKVRRLSVGFNVLLAAAAFVVLAGLMSIRRKNRALAASKREIEKINADLEVRNAEISRQKEIIEQKNQSITDSIQYASRIQGAVLPPADFLSGWDFDNFILFMPKDIVSGDFYWGRQKNEKIIIAAADCTGHGVPGAFMSMLGHAFLDEIVTASEFLDAASILDRLREEIISTLKQRGITGETRDGMDISLCIIDREKGTADFAGANNPLYIIRENKLLKYPADKMPIGIHVSAITPFTNNHIRIRKDDILYLFTDGFADQFGGDKGRKFMYKPFQDLLLKIHTKRMTDQKEALRSAFSDWKGDLEQVDDVLVIGMKI